MECNFAQTTYLSASLYPLPFVPAPTTDLFS
nr:MAG TPA: hypothetical protein [Caudoviricetes sp.]